MVTSDEGLRGGRTLKLKGIVDESLEGLDFVETCFVFSRTGTEVPMKKGRDINMNEAMKTQRPFCPAEPMDSEDTLFLLYTSGSTGAPKGVAHTTAGYLLWASMTHKYVFDLREEDVFACVADCGWITGHSYIVYGPLCNGATTVMFESTPLYPDASRYAHFDMGMQCAVLVLVLVLVLLVLCLLTVFGAATRMHPTLIVFEGHLRDVTCFALASLASLPF